MSIYPINVPSAEGGRYILPVQVQTVGKVLFQLPLMRQLEPYARKAASVSEAHQSLSFDPRPGRPAPTDLEHFSLLSANLCHDWPRFRRTTERLADFAALVEREDIDILLLQEVAHLPDLHIGDWLSDRLGMAHVYSRANGHQDIGFEEGLAILSRFPIAQPQIHRLGNRWNPFVHRLALGADILLPGYKLTAFSVHLGILPRDNSRQMDNLHQLIRDQDGNQPVIIGGDFNARETSVQMTQTSSQWIDTYRQLHPHGAAYTHSLNWPWGGVLRQQRLDYMFLHAPDSSWEVIESRHITTPLKAHSDHRAVLTRISL